MPPVLHSGRRAQASLESLVILAVFLLIISGWAALYVKLEQESRAALDKQELEAFSSMLRNEINAVCVLSGGSKTFEATMDAIVETKTDSVNACSGKFSSERRVECAVEGSRIDVMRGDVMHIEKAGALVRLRKN